MTLNIKTAKAIIRHSKCHPIFTGIENFDKITNGLKSGDIILIGGRPATGKTAFALSIANELSLNQYYGICYYSFELSSNQLICRMGNVERIKHLKQSNENFFIYDTPKITIQDIEHDIRTLNLSHDINVVIIDYIQLLPNCEKVELWTQLKKIAVEEQIIFVILSQLKMDITEEQKDISPMSGFVWIKPDENMVDHLFFL